MVTRRASSSETLFSHAVQAGRLPGKPPLAERMRPGALDAYVGQEAALGGFLARAIREDRLPSLVLWGPPGSGKTSLGKVIAGHTQAELVPFSAVLGSLAELREIVEGARQRRADRGQRTIVFVDEIHRFNKAQQDAFLPHVEAATIVLIGATTENPSFSINAALLSRCRVVRLQPLEEAQLLELERRALAQDTELAGVEATDEALAAIARAAQGDARRALGTLELAAAHAGAHHPIDLEVLGKLGTAPAPLLYDKRGEEHYNVVSAFIKSMRASDPDAAIYWMMRMLEAAEDPLFVSRRMIIFASEDVGAADPQALVVANAADQAFRRLGMPEGIYPLAQAALHLANAPKSRAVSEAWQAAKAAIDEDGALPVPLGLRNPVTKLMRDDGYGGGLKPGESCLPEKLRGAKFWREPT